MGIGSAILGARPALLLSLRDVVRRLRNRGARVNPLLALVFGSPVGGIAILAVLVTAAIFVFGG